ncbi:hypothetical protein TYRP_014706 [Tyrophagus putrescentiae]|nr:hypothetical protein TYRP_014706 [Tyrophagus putrescentiae]
MFARFMNKNKTGRRNYPVPRGPATFERLAADLLSQASALGIDLSEPKRIVYWAYPDLESLERRRTGDTSVRAMSIAIHRVHHAAGQTSKMLHVGHVKRMEANCLLRKVNCVPLERLAAIRVFEYDAAFSTLCCSVQLRFRYRRAGDTVATPLREKDILIWMEPEVQYRLIADLAEQRLLARDRTRLVPPLGIDWVLRPHLEHDMQCGCPLADGCCKQIAAAALEAEAKAAKAKSGEAAPKPKKTVTWADLQPKASTPMGSPKADQILIKLSVF